MKVKAYTLNSFAKQSGGGNPAGVVLDAGHLSENEMKKIAGIIGFSETAFIMKSDCADFKVRFFTPSEEVDLCGHATIGAFYTLSALGMIGTGLYKQETKAGVLEVAVKEDFSVLMDQNVPSFYEIVPKKEIADSLNISIGSISEELPAQIVSTGLKDIMIPIRSLEGLRNIRPDFRKVEEVSRKYGVVGYHIFTLETLHNSTACCRNLAPLYGIPEESATGTSNGALSCYLYKYGKLTKRQAEAVVIEQGYSMNRPSEILISLTIEENEVKAVKVGGKALDLAQTVIEI